MLTGSHLLYLFLQLPLATSHKSTVRLNMTHGHTETHKSTQEHIRAQYNIQAHKSAHQSTQVQKLNKAYKSTIEHNRAYQSTITHNRTQLSTIEHIRTQQNTQALLAQITPKTNLKANSESRKTCWDIQQFFVCSREMRLCHNCLNLSS